jgi:glycerol-3-phosphate dehydrogenase
MATLELNHTSSILIVGAGTWGCSTALHLARRGYKNVKVLDPHPVPSPIAAGNDINKIMEHKELKCNQPIHPGAKIWKPANIHQRRRPMFEASRLQFAPGRH